MTDKNRYLYFMKKRQEVIKLYLVVGLGNPGRQYEMTRHNIGFETIDYISREYSVKVNKIKHKGLLGEGFIQSEKVMLLKPQTFMNLSGESVREASSFYKIPPENIIVIYDDISLPSGSVRIRAKGSAGGHNGIKSIIYQLESDNFPRIKLGVGQPKHKGYDLKDYVLGHFSNDEMPGIIEAVKSVPDIICTIINQGCDKAANKFNKTVKSGEV